MKMSFDIFTILMPAIKPDTLALPAEYDEVMYSDSVKQGS